MADWTFQGAVLIESTGIYLYANDKNGTKVSAINIRPIYPNTTNTSYNHNLMIDQYAFNNGNQTGGYERYYLPVPASTAVNEGYMIITTKNISDIPNASTSTTGLINTGTQAFAGNKIFTNHVTLQSSAYLTWLPTGHTQAASFIYTFNMGNLPTDQPQIGFYQYPYSSSTTRLAYYERFALPAPTSTITTYKYYKILTTKEYTLPTTWRAATSDTSGVVTIYSQNFAGEKTFSSPINIYQNIRLGVTTSATKVAANGITTVNRETDSTDHRLRFFQYSFNSDYTRTDYLDYFNLPPMEVGKTSNGNYDILTTKDSSVSKTVTYVTNDILSSADGITLRKLGNTCILNVQVASATFKANQTAQTSFITLATIPADCYPIGNIYVTMPQLSTSFYYTQMLVNTTGSIRFYHPTTSTALFRGEMVWFTK